MANNQSNRWKKWLAPTIKLAIVVLIVWFIRGTLADAWQKLGQYAWHFDPVWLMLSGGLYLAGVFACGLFWHRVLLALGQDAGLAETLRAYYIGHLGKYVPGKAMVVILRAGLIRSHRVDAALAAVSVFFETLTMMAVGAFLAAAVVAIWFNEQSLLFWASVAMMLVSGIPTLPPVFRRLVRLAGARKWGPGADEKLAKLGYGITLTGWVLTSLGWVLLGLSLWAVLKSIGAAETNPLAQLHLYVASVSLATVAGFASFVPGGAVVREAVLTELIAPHFGGAAALIGALLLRLVWLVSELVISGILYFVARRRTPPDH